MAKNNKKETEKIVEKEPVVIDEKAIVPGEELSNDEVIEVEAPEVIVENSDGDIKTDESNVEAPEAPKMPEFKKLICKQSFVDKYNDKVVYKIGDELNVTDVARRNDLIERGLAVEE